MEKRKKISFRQQLIKMEVGRVMYIDYSKMNSIRSLIYEISVTTKQFYETKKEDDRLAIKRIS